MVDIVAVVPAIVELLLRKPDVKKVALSVAGIPDSVGALVENVSISVENWNVVLGILVVVGITISAVTVAFVVRFFSVFRLKTVSKLPRNPLIAANDTITAAPVHAAEKI